MIAMNEMIIIGKTIDGFDFLGLAGGFFVDEGHKGLEGRRLVVVLAQGGGIASRVCGEGSGIPHTGAADTLEGALEVEFLPEVAVLCGAVDILADGEGTGSGVLRPPAAETVVVGCGMSNLPIDLRHGVVHPTLVNPVDDIGVEVVIVLQTAGVRSGDGAAVLLVVVDAEGTDAELHPGLCLVDGTMEHLDEEVYVVASPVAAVADAVVVFLERGIVGDGLSGYGVGVEVVVDMEAVNIVATDDVLHHLTDVLAVLVEGGVEDEQVVISEEALGPLHIGVVVGQLGGTFRLGAVGIYPGVEFHLSLVTFAYHPFQRVPVGCGGLTLQAGEETAPRFIGGSVHSIGFTAYLKHHGVDATLLHSIELFGEASLRAFGAEALELAVDDLHPRTAELAFRGCGNGEGE